MEESNRTTGKWRYLQSNRLPNTNNTFDTRNLRLVLDRNDAGLNALDCPHCSRPRSNVSNKPRPSPTLHSSGHIRPSCAYTRPVPIPKPFCVDQYEPMYMATSSVSFGPTHMPPRSHSATRLRPSPSRDNVRFMGNGPTESPLDNRPSQTLSHSNSLINLYNALNKTREEKSKLIFEQLEKIEKGFYEDLDRIKENKLNMYPLLQGTLQLCLSILRSSKTPGILASCIDTVAQLLEKIKSESTDRPNPINMEFGNLNLKADVTPMSQVGISLDSYNSSPSLNPHDKDMDKLYQGISEAGLDPPSGLINSMQSLNQQDGQEGQYILKLNQDISKIGLNPPSRLINSILSLKPHDTEGQDIECVKKIYEYISEVDLSLELPSDLTMGEVINLGFEELDISYLLMDKMKKDSGLNLG